MTSRLGQNALVVDDDASSENPETDYKKPAAVDSESGESDNVIHLADKGFGEASKTADPNRTFVRRGVGMNIDQPERRSANRERMAALKEEIGDAPVTGIEDRPAYRFAKRAFDIVFSLFVLIAFSWLFAIVAIAIKIDDPKGPVIFKQIRVGKDGKTFTMHKFRSMYADAEERLEELKELNEKTGPVFKIADDPRITKVGKFIRKTSIDELCQFWDVLTWRFRGTFR